LSIFLIATIFVSCYCNRIEFSAENFNKEESKIENENFTNYGVVVGKAGNADRCLKYEKCRGAPPAPVLAKVVPPTKIPAPIKLTGVPTKTAPQRKSASKKVKKVKKVTSLSKRFGSVKSAAKSVVQKLVASRKGKTPASKKQNKAARKSARAQKKSCSQAS
jgi:type IV secretory pathway VirB10-like protein